MGHDVDDPHDGCAARAASAKPLCGAGNADKPCAAVAPDGSNLHDAARSAFEVAGLLLASIRMSINQPSLINAAPQAAASNSAPEGQCPSAAIGARVTSRFSRAEQKNAECTAGGTCRRNLMFGAQAKPAGYCAPPIANVAPGSAEA